MKALSTQIELKNGNLKTICVEVEDDIAGFLESKNKEEVHDFLVFEWKSKQVERKETRRHSPMSATILDCRQDIDFILECEQHYRDEIETHELQKQVFAKYLTKRQADAFYQFVILKYKKTKIAKNMGVTESAVRKLIEKATNIMNPYAYKALRYFEGKKFVIEDDDNLADEVIYADTNYLKWFLKNK